MGCVVNDNLPFSELPKMNKKVGIVLIAAILVTGLVEHQTVSVMRVAEIPSIEFCARYDANGRELQASMVMATLQEDDIHLPVPRGGAR